MVTIRGKGANSQNPMELNGGTPPLQAIVKPTADSANRSTATVATIKVTRVTRCMAGVVFARLNVRYGSKAAVPLKARWVEWPGLFMVRGGPIVRVNGGADAACGGALICDDARGASDDRTL